MRTPRSLLALTLVNLVLAIVLVGGAFRSTPQATPDVVRARALEIVDARGQVRSRINVEESGEVVFRLVDRTGAIRVKLGGGVDGSGLVLMDEETEPSVQIVSRRRATATKPNTTMLTLRAAGGREHRIAP